MRRKPIQDPITIRTLVKAFTNRYEWVKVELLGDRIPVELMADGCYIPIKVK